MSSCRRSGGAVLLSVVLLQVAACQVDDPSASGPLHHALAVEVNDALRPLQWYLSAARIDEAWELNTGSPLVVAVIDFGVRPGHPDLTGRVLPGYDFVSAADRAGDADGRDADATPCCGPEAEEGLQHAGILAAVANDGQGMAGISWQAKILPIRVLDAELFAIDSDIVDAIRWAAGLEVAGVPKNPTPAKVINLSIGSPGANKVLDEAIEAAIGSGAIVVAAAGSDGEDRVDDVYPAASPGVIAVGATGYDGKRAEYSNTGPVVDLMAPGGSYEPLPFEYEGQTMKAGIIGTSYDENGGFNHHMSSGTGRAAVVVSGVVALMASVDPDLTAERALETLQQSANPAGRCPEGCGAGALDARRALELMGAVPPQAESSGGCALTRAKAATGTPLLIYVLLALAAMKRRRGRPRAGSTGSARQAR